jgi:hypothetical protein
MGCVVPGDTPAAVSGCELQTVTIYWLVKGVMTTYAR